MKKIKKIILLVLLSLPMVVKADMGAPMSTYQARISNVNGADIYEYNQNTQNYEKTDKKLNYDEVYYIQYEQIINNELFGCAVTKDEEGNFKGYYYIKLSDVKPLEVKLEDYKNKNKNKKKYYVFDDSNYLYKGPSTLYGKVEPEIALESGMTIEVEYYDEMWAYVEYKGVKGWVYTYTFGNKFRVGIELPLPGLAYVSEDSTSNNLLTLKDIELYVSPKEERKSGDVIPKDKEIKILYSYTLLDEGFKSNYYVEYNGIKGWLKEEYGTTIFNKDGEAGAINLAYRYLKGFVGVKNQDGIKLYSDFNDENSVIATIPYKEKINIVYGMNSRHTSVSYKVEYNGLVGWIDGKEEFYYYDENGNIKEEVVTNPQQNIIGNVIEDDVEEETDEVLEKETSINEKIIYYICGTIVVCLTAFVTILLVNKKRKLKNDDK